MSTEFDKNFSKGSYCSTDHKNYIKTFFEHFPSKLLDPQKSRFGDLILGIIFFLKQSYQKSWYSPMKFCFWKILIIFDIERWLWKSEFCNLAGLITSTQNVQKNVQSHFCDEGVLVKKIKPTVLHVNIVS